MSTSAKIRVLVVDDSAIVRKVISDILSGEADIEVVGTAPDPYVARDKILALHPDVLTLDIEMPRMDGLTFLDRIMRFHPLPVIVISSLTQSSTRAALEAMTRGAVDVLAKPGGPYSVGDLKLDLPHRIRAAARARLRQPAAAAPVAVSAPVAAPAVAASTAIPSRLIAIGASTGGTQAIEQILAPLPRNMPPIVVTQHIPAGFSTAFAERLNRVCALEVQEARGGEILRSGLALIAPGNFHLVVERNPGGGWRARLDEGPKVCYQRPSVDVMFQSVCSTAASSTLAVLLTGMGSDGAEGMAALRKAGAATIAQDEATCVVFGMPREAIRLGAAQHILPLPEIAQLLIRPPRS
ncbi:MAG: chemotaxis response regulator protein-glutamate methylesterase [Bryobacterales bacterium]|nr:chemotaxis response regulator protein-glutamate methylesterase [Bryobacterales bacterium]